MRSPALLLLTATLALLACGAPVTGSPGGGATGSNGHLVSGLAPTFSLQDVNPASPSVGQALTPESQRGAVSGWYFGQSS